MITDVRPPEPDQLRDTAVRNLRKKRDLQAHLLAYVMVNLLFNGIWLAITPGGFYWPMFPLLGWGIGLAFHVWDVYAPGLSENKVQREMRRLSGK